MSTRASWEGRKPFHSGNCHMDNVKWFPGEALPPSPPSPEAPLALQGLAQCCLFTQVCSAVPGSQERGSSLSPEAALLAHSLGLFFHLNVLPPPQALPLDTASFQGHQKTTRARQRPKVLLGGCFLTKGLASNKSQIGPRCVNLP